MSLGEGGPCSVVIQNALTGGFVGRTVNIRFSDEIVCASGSGTFRSTRRTASIELTRQERPVPGSIGTIRHVSQHQDAGQLRATGHGRRNPRVGSAVRPKTQRVARPVEGERAVFNQAVDEVTEVAQRLIRSLTTSAPPRNREIEARKQKSVRASDTPKKIPRPGRPPVYLRPPLPLARGRWRLP